MFLTIDKSTLITTLLSICIILSTILVSLTYRILKILTRTSPRAQQRSTVSTDPRTKRHQSRSNKVTAIPSNTDQRGHLLIVLGSGGHTAEMLSILQNLGGEYLSTRFSHRTWIVSTGDNFSAERARIFEANISQQHALKPPVSQPGISTQKTTATATTLNTAKTSVQWDIVTVTRARKVHQPLLTTPLSALVCSWDCIRVLRGKTISSNLTTTMPDLILTNGPGTGVIVVLASLLLLFLGIAPLYGPGSMRCVYIESWARVKTLSLSGKILRWMVARFLVQWEGLADDDATVMNRAGVGGVKEGKGNSLDRGVVNVVSRGSLPRRIEYVGAVVA